MPVFRTLARDLASAAGAAAAAGLAYHRSQPLYEQGHSDPAATINAFTPAEVAQHSTPDDLWVTLEGNVYDLSAFAQHHPGGADNLMKAAGGDASYFVAYFGVHTQSATFKDVLKASFIGELSTPAAPSAATTPSSTSAATSDVATHVEELYHSVSQPRRDPVLLKPPSDDMRRVPFTGEPRGFYPHVQYTPNDSFYVRNHAPVPTDLPRSVRLLFHPESRSNGGSADDPPDANCAHSAVDVEVDLDEAEATYGTVTLAATLQCAGNRLDERGRLGDCMFDPSRMGSKGWIGNAMWQGVLLSNLLCAHLPPSVVTEAKMDGDDGVDGGWHAVFTGADGYEASVPLKYVLGDQSGSAPFLLATKMNGEQLPPDHGAPVRVLAPGFIGARNVKWISEITIQQSPSQSPWQRRFYTEDEPLRNEDGARPPLFWWPVQSIITSHNHNDDIVLHDAATAEANVNRRCQSTLATAPVGGSNSDTRSSSSSSSSILVTGVGYSGKGRVVERVEVSGDNGKTWQHATMTGEQEGLYAFRLWETRLSLENITLHAHLQGDDTSPADNVGSNDGSSGTSSGEKSGEKGGGMQYIEIWCRATDSSGEVQPLDPLTPGPFRESGYLFNPVQMIRLNVATNVHFPT